MTTPSSMPSPAASQLGKFEYHAPDLEQIKRIQAVRAGFHHVQALIETHLPISQERSVATTNLRQAMFWANAAIVLNGPPGS